MSIGNHTIEHEKLGLDEEIKTIAIRNCGVPSDVDLSPYLKAATAEVTYLRLDCANDPLTAALDMGNNVINNIGAAGTDFSATGGLTLADDLALGANDITMTGSLATTGARVTKGWFTDIEVTNMPTVGGTSIAAIFLRLDTTNDPLTGALDMGNNVINNIGAAGTDFSATGGLTLADDLAMGANDITMTGSLATNANRVTKGWFTDIDITNMPTIGGISVAAIFLRLDAANDPVTKGLEINAATSAEDVLTLQTTDDDLGSLMLDCQSSAGATVASISAVGVGTFGGATTGQSTIAWGLVVNDGGGTGAAHDFRAETDNEANALVVDATNDEIDISVTTEIQSTHKLQFRDAAIYINSQTDAYMDLTADNAIRQSAPDAAPVLANNATLSFYFDEAGHNLKCVAKYSDGTAKTATIAFD